MGNYDQLKNAVAAVIHDNGAEYITGDRLQDVLVTIINSVGAGATFAGVALPNTNPGTPDPNMFYLAGKAGTYTNFNVTITKGLWVFTNDGGTWTGTDLQVSMLFATGEDVTETSIAEDITQGASDDLPTVGAVRGALEAEDDKFFNEVAYGDIDDLATFDEAFAGSESGTPAYYTVYVMVNSHKVKVGTMEIVSDNMAHVVTQVMVTHYVLDENGAITGAHADGDLFRIFRSKKIHGGTLPTDDWTPWSYVNETEWKKIVSGADAVPTAGSTNVVKSGGVAAAIESLETADETIQGTFFNEVAYEDLGNIKLYIDTLAGSQSGTPAYYTVYKAVGDDKVKVGTLQVISDSSRGVLTQIFETHYTLDGSGNLSAVVDDDHTFRIARSVTYSGGLVSLWSPWSYVNGSVVEDAVAEAAETVDKKATHRGVLVKRVSNYSGGANIQTSTSDYMRWGETEKREGNVPYIEYSNETSGNVYIALVGIQNINLAYSFKNITVVDGDGNIIYENCINFNNYTVENNVVGVVLPSGCKLMANAREAYEGVVFSEGYYQSAFPYTDDDFCNTCLRELYIERTTAEEPTIRLAREFSGNGKWVVYLFDGNTQIVGVNYTQEPSESEIIHFENEGNSVYAIVNWHDLLKGASAFVIGRALPASFNSYNSPVINGFLNGAGPGPVELGDYVFAQDHDVVAFNPTYSGWDGSITVSEVEDDRFGYTRIITKIVIGENEDVNTFAINTTQFVATCKADDIAYIDWYLYSPIETNITLVRYNNTQAIAFVDDNGTVSNTKNVAVSVGVNKFHIALKIITAGSTGQSQLYFKNTNFCGETVYTYANLYVGNVKYLSTNSPEPSTPTIHIYAVGDSLTEGAWSGGHTYEVELESLLSSNVEIHNYGIGGEAVGTIFGRLNTIPMKVAENMTISASKDTGVTIKLKDDFGSWLLPLLHINDNSHAVCIAGVKGVLSTNAEPGDLSASYTFKRSANGEQVSIKEGEPVFFESTNHDGIYLSHRYGAIPSDSYQIIWVGQNGGYKYGGDTGRYQPNMNNQDPNLHITQNDADKLVSMIRQHISVSSPLKYLVLSAPNNTNGILESTMSMAFGGSYVNVREQMVNNGIRIAKESGYLVGDYPTPQDIDDMNNGIVPSSLRHENDNTHFNPAGYKTLGRILKDYVNNVWGIE